MGILFQNSISCLKNDFFSNKPNNNLICSSERSEHFFCKNNPKFVKPNAKEIKDNLLFVFSSNSNLEKSGQK